MLVLYEWDQFSCIIHGPPPHVVNIKVWCSLVLKFSIPNSDKRIDLQGQEKEAESQPIKDTAVKTIGITADLITIIRLQLLCFLLLSLSLSL
jgi:hypothetical protein